MTQLPAQDQVRLAELVSALSLGIDLGFGQPMEHVLRQCLIALRLADAAGLDPEARQVVYYSALLLNVGCHTDAHEQARWFGDDVAVKRIKYDRDPLSPRTALKAMSFLGSGHPLLSRFKVGLEYVLSGHRELDDMLVHHAQIARTMAGQLGLPAAVLDALSAGYERWDGRGFPGRLKGAAVPIAARIALIAEFVEVAHRVGGAAAVHALAKERRGGDFDPGLADLLLERADALLEGLETVQVWEAVIAAEPALAVTVSGERFDDALLAVASFVDLKSPYFLGHGRAVSELAAAAGQQLGLPAADLTLLRRAALVHGLGRLGISNAILDKQGPLGAGEWERIRMQPYLTERMLRQSKSLAPLARLAAQHRERLDGSGSPHGLSGAALSREARILAAAEAYQAMREPRPHRPERGAEDAAAQLRADVRNGRFDRDAVEAVLGAAGHRVRRRREGPNGLTAREVEVLRLLARGLPNKEIAQKLAISPKTVANHAEHIYAKLGISSRAAAGLFAMQHGLLPEDEFLAA